MKRNGIYKSNNSVSFPSSGGMRPVSWLSFNSLQIKFFEVEESFSNENFQNSFYQSNLWLPKRLTN